MLLAFRIPEAAGKAGQGELGGLDHESLGRSLHQVGICLASLGQYAVARPWYERAAGEAQKGDVPGRLEHASLQLSLDALKE